MIFGRSADSVLGIQRASHHNAIATAHHGCRDHRSGMVPVPGLVWRNHACPGGANGRRIGRTRSANLEPHKPRLKAEVKWQARMEVREGQAEVEQGGGSRERGAGQPAICSRAYSRGSRQQSSVCGFGEVLVGCGELGNHEAGLQRQAAELGPRTHQCQHPAPLLGRSLARRLPVGVGRRHLI
jgi:hypothetical protein